MITLANRVRTLLGSAGAPVWYFYPQSWIQLPVISWRESGNREFAQADGGEHLAELEYTVDIWSRGRHRRRNGLGPAPARLFGRSVRAVDRLPSPLGALPLRGRRGGQHLSMRRNEHGNERTGNPFQIHARERHAGDRGPADVDRRDRAHL